MREHRTAMLHGLGTTRTDDDDGGEALARAMAAFTRAELAAPVATVGGYIDLLREDAERQGLADYAADLGKMQGARDRLGGLVEHLLEADPAGFGTDLSARTGKIRHDLRTPIAAILGYGELLAEQAEDDGHAGFAEILAGLLEATRRLLGQVDMFVDTVRASGSDEEKAATTGPAAQARRETIEAIRSVLVHQPDMQAALHGRIVLVDDDPSNLDLLGRRLSRDGHAITSLSSGEAVLEFLQTNVTDLVLLDLIMPGLNGIEVLRELRSREDTRATPVLIISGLDESDGAISCIEAGADDYLTKPVDPVLLRARINAALERKQLRDRDIAITRRLQAEQARAEGLLRNMLPGSVVERLRGGETTIADHFESATILFCDIVGFTAMASQLTAGDTLDVLNTIFSAFDRLAADLQVEKIKTIGDAYMVAAGLPEPRPEHAQAVAALAMRLPGVVEAISAEVGKPLAVRIGMDTGPVAAGIIGTDKFSYDVWGDAVNTASRMEHHGVPGRVHITEATRLALGDRYAYDALAPIEVKGKGLMQTYLIV